MRKEEKLGAYLTWVKKEPKIWQEKKNTQPNNTFFYFCSSFFIYLKQNKTTQTSESHSFAILVQQKPSNI